ncbi:hypothetical protein HK097_004755, partial [Rhizophlyctis rosea]
MQTRPLTPQKPKSPPPADDWSRLASSTRAKITKRGGQLDPIVVRSAPEPTSRQRSNVLDGRKLIAKKAEDGAIAEDTEGGSRSG